MRWWVVLCAMPLGAVTPAEIGRTLLEVRADPPSVANGHGASPKLNVLKRQLRDWVEQSLAGVAPTHDADHVARIITEPIGQWICPPRCHRNEESFLGNLSVVVSRPEPGWLFVQTQVGIVCGHDASVYLYQYVGSEWRRRITSEMNDYSTSKIYQPVIVESLALSAAAPDSRRLAALMGYSPWCSSNWRSTTVRLWSLDSKSTTLLLDQQRPSFFGIDRHLTVTPAHVTWEFSMGSVSPSQHSFRSILRITAGARRLPMAETARDFLDEWLQLPWSEAVSWVAVRSRERASRVPRGSVTGEFEDTIRCSPDLTLWQSSVSLERHATIFVLIRDFGSKAFEIVDVANEPFAFCGREAAP